MNGAENPKMRSYWCRGGCDCGCFFVNCFRASSQSLKAPTHNESDTENSKNGFLIAVMNMLSQLLRPHDEALKLKTKDLVKSKENLKDCVQPQSRMTLTATL
jgi:hypothetical protein